MIEAIAEMPPGTVGWVATGKLSREDYPRVIEPLRAMIDAGEKVRMLYQIGPDFHGLHANAVWEDVKADLGLGIGHLKAWERTALVSDESWMSHLAAVAGWMLPGELKLFPLAELEAAKEWLAR